MRRRKNYEKRNYSIEKFIEGDLPRYLKKIHSVNTKLYLKMRKKSSKNVFEMNEELFICFIIVQE